MTSSKTKLYWLSQISGWFTYVLLMGLLNKLEGVSFDYTSFLKLLLTFVLGIVSSHLYRQLIISRNWLKLKIAELIPRVIGASVVFGGLFIFAHTFISETLITAADFQFDLSELLLLTLNLAVIFILWSLLYFLYHFIKNYRKEEIKNLKWQALQNEIELNKLKSQLNPHFIFNSMNTIRALVDEDPKKSKDSITQLANILRTSLLMGRKKVISLKEELNLVNDYLSLEKNRFEERLCLQFDIEKGTEDHLVPPMLLQTLVENGIKHGISKLPEGGEVKVIAKKDGDFLKIKIFNHGQLDQAAFEASEGFGLANTIERLKLLYGKQAFFDLKNADSKTVEAEVWIPNSLQTTNITSK
jgi:sensor histidine kinase YesM